MPLTQAVILCVDDEVLVLECLERQLRRAFSNLYRYEFAESADEALEIVEKLVEAGIQILVIISDWLMPGMKGDEFFLIIHNKYPDIVTILLTGQADQSAVERAMTQANLHAYLYKPWKSKELIDTIKSGLAKL